MNNTEPRPELMIDPDGRDQEWSEETRQRPTPQFHRRPARNIDRLRQGDERTLREFFLYFQPVLLEQARFLGVDPGLRKEMVVTFLDDTVMELVEMDVPPRSLTGYVIRAFRNRFFNHIRDRKTRDRIYDEAASQMRVAEESATYESDTGADDDELMRASLPIAQLARFAREHLTTEDTQLLIAASQHIPLRDIAAWHNMTYGACRVRIHRLRLRISQLTRGYLGTLAPDERIAVETFLRRSGALEE